MSHILKELMNQVQGREEKYPNNYNSRENMISTVREFSCRQVQSPERSRVFGEDWGNFLQMAVVELGHKIWVGLC